ncbi:MAG TPA: aldo/keto reductase [Mycobacteriales bacterium]|nr:aldo/keto reductase [Mycobacteriales bacterium]
MRYRPLGESGLMVSVVGLGCNNIGRPQTRTATLEGSRAVVHAAIDAGITLFDTSDGYGRPRGIGEELLGTCLAGRRDDVIIATKFGWEVGGANGADWGARGSRRYIRRAIETSLRRLGTDWIDLYMYHRPDGLTPIEETLSALTELVTAGLVRYVGSSNMAAWQVVEADCIARSAGTVRFVSAENEYSLLDRDAERELLPACAKYGVGVLPYFPLANGLLTGKYSRAAAPPAGTRIGDIKPSAHTHADWDRIEALTKYAEDRGVTLLDVAIGGLAAQPAVGSVIAGATSPEQIRANVAAGDWVPSADDVAALNAL